MAKSRTEFLGSLPPSGGDESPLAALLRAGRVIRLRGSDKRLFFEQLVSSAARVLNLSAGEQLDLSAAVLAREAMLNTQLGPGWAAPHATLDIGEEVVLIVGRSKAGFDYGRPELGRVHLVFLFISSPAGHDKYLKALSALVAAFKDAPQRLQAAIAAESSTDFISILASGTVKAGRVRLSRRLPQVIRALLRNMQRFADEIDAGTLLLFTDVVSNPLLLA